MSTEQQITAPEFEQMIEDMMRAHREGNLGRYVSTLFERTVVRRMTPSTAALMRPCLPHLGIAIDTACPLEVRPTPSGLEGRYGLHGLRRGDVFIVIANARNSVGVGVELPTMPPGAGPAAFWSMVSQTIDAINAGNDAMNTNLLIASIFSRLGTSWGTFRDMTLKLRLSGLPLIMAIAGIAGESGTRAGGELLTLPLPLIVADDDEERPAMPKVRLQ